ncbi:DUF1566 domain-containing protein [Methylomonas methanica]|uniref:Lcl C-terminal domain-containing protein n=1 Tax=Methylomonas methanica (strain DSM 25384 / MC09) TaxID=857087 RepID=G0A5T4_METMM|nr:DUF1566 domain-containing protein [Methylomonas methanica]AEF99211.1 protein of unknown function DUF1555 [Methylomonas methanica MC09]
MNDSKMKISMVLLCVASFNVDAALSSVDNGLGVYASGMDATWTSDANLLGTLEANAIASGDAGAGNLISAIIDASGGVIHDTPNPYDNGTYALSVSDFFTGGTFVQGRTTWWGAQAFVNYLNSIEYGNSNQWALPTSNAVADYDNGSQLGALFYDELGGTADNNIPINSLFSNQITDQYWSGTEYALNPVFAWKFNNSNGYQNVSGKDALFYVWAVRPSAVPLPSALWMFGTGILALVGLKRSVQAG